MAAIIRRRNLPFKFTQTSDILYRPREGCVSSQEATRLYKVSETLLRRLLTEGTCLVERAPGVTGLHLFDKERLESALAAMRASLRPSQVASALAVPAFVLPAVVEAGLIERCNNSNACIMSQHQLYSAESVEALLRRFTDLPMAMSSAGKISLRDALARDLSPHAWVAALTAVAGGELKAYVRANGELRCGELLVEEAQLLHKVRAARLRPLPELKIAGCVAGPIIGSSDVILGSAVVAGLIERDEQGFELSELESFRRNYVLPAEIKEWFTGSGIAFAELMHQAGVAPVAKLSKINLWRRDDVTRIHGSQETRNSRAIESARAE